MNYEWQVVGHEVVYQGYFRMERYRLRHELFAGGMSGEFMREIFERGHAVGVLPYDPKRDRVILIEQFRAGAIGLHEPPWLKEIVAGIIEPGEAHEEVAQREALEEAGCEIIALEPVSRYFVSPGGTTEQCILFCGRVDSSEVEGIHGLADEDEDIRVEAVDLAEAARWLADGRINSSPAIIALQWLLLHRDELRARWNDTSN